MLASTGGGPMRSVLVQIFVLTITLAATSSTTDFFFKCCENKVDARPCAPTSLLAKPHLAVSLLVYGQIVFLFIESAKN